MEVDASARWGDSSKLFPEGFSGRDFGELFQAGIFFRRVPKRLRRGEVPPALLGARVFELAQDFLVHEAGTQPFIDPAIPVLVGVLCDDS